jgi:NAD(P)-dependent dehydrogenase (short-subunit alcohol dehydrogenase family)
MNITLGDLQGKTAVITGAASGFGREFALLCGTAGMRLVLTDVDAEALLRRRRHRSARHALGDPGHARALPATKAAARTIGVPSRHFADLKELP